MAKGVAILSGLPETTTGKVVNRFLWFFNGFTSSAKSSNKL